MSSSDRHGMSASDSKEGGTASTGALLLAAAAAASSGNFSERQPQQQLPSSHNGHDTLAQARAILTSHIGQLQPQQLLTQQHSQQLQQLQQAQNHLFPPTRGGSDYQHQQHASSQQQSQLSQIQALQALLSSQQQTQQQQGGLGSSASSLLGSLAFASSNPSTSEGGFQSSLFGGQHQQHPPALSQAPACASTNTQSKPVADTAQELANLLASQPEAANAFQSALQAALSSSSHTTTNSSSTPNPAPAPMNNNMSQQEQRQEQGTTTDFLQAALASLAGLGAMQQPHQAPALPPPQPQQQNQPQQQGDPQQQQQSPYGSLSLTDLQQLQSQLQAQLQAHLLPQQQQTPQQPTPPQQQHQSSAMRNVGQGQPPQSTAKSGGGTTTQHQQQQQQQQDGSANNASATNNNNSAGAVTFTLPTNFAAAPGTNNAAAGGMASVAGGQGQPSEVSGSTSTSASPSAIGTRDTQFDQETEDLLANIPPMPAELEEMKKKKPRGRSSTFPRKLFQMLTELEEQEGGAAIASFLLPHGRSFRIHKPKEFTRDIMPKYFQMSSFSSFQRQLNLYDFQRITDGPDRDAYYHELFVREQPLLCTRIKRNKVKGLTRAKQEERFMTYEKNKKKWIGE